MLERTIRRGVERSGDGEILPQAEAELSYAACVLQQGTCTLP